ncbi:MAG: delta-60 repeat domain-containing protein [Flavobacteriales bacterium]|nr:delta-60 repeat domain-containing protein [Flavobacteriales bacterium]
MRSILTLLLMLALTASAQTPGSIDPLFNASDIGYGRGDGFLGYVHCTTIQADGKILVGGDFVSHSGVGSGTTFTNINRLARLNSDGTLDQSFSVGTGFNTGTVRKILVQSDGKIIVLGDFTSYNGTTAVGIVRLTSTGAVDPFFTTGTGFTGGYPKDAVIQSNGRIVVVGTFTGYNGNACSKIARLTTGGIYDLTLLDGSGFTGASVNAIAMQADGSFVIGGEFTVYDGFPCGNIVRVASNGWADMTYNPGGVGADAAVEDVVLQADGKAVVVGYFFNVGGLIARRVVRLLTTGEVDTNFSTGTGPNSQVTDVALTSTGKVLIAGFFTSVNGSSSPYFARLNSNGSVDGTFVVNSGADYLVYGMAVRSDDKVVITGGFRMYNGVLRQGIALVNTDGSTDTGFFAGSGVAKKVTWIARVQSIALQPDGKALVGGSFLGYNDKPASDLIRVNADGSHDPTFSTGSIDHLVEVRAVVVQPDGKVVVGSNFGFAGSTSQGITRLTSTGALDPGFAAGTGFTGEVRALALQPDGKILVAGNMTAYNGSACARVVRLNVNGTLDATFNAGIGPGGPVNAIALLSDGSVMIGGSFSQVNGVARGGLAKLSSSGVLDPSFPSGAGISGTGTPSLAAIAVLPDGRVLVGGDFTQVHGVSRSRIARLLSTGEVDVTFDPGFGAGSNVRCMALQPDGKVVVGGSFTTFDGVVRHLLARLNTDGSVDQNYPVQWGTGFGVFALAMLPDGDVLAGGEFTELNDVGKNRLARVNGGDVSVAVSPRVFLQGPYDSGTQTMSDALRVAGLVPSIEPYSALGYVHAAGGGGSSVLPAMLAATGTNAIVDHVVVELRDATSPSLVVATRGALVQRDGDVVGMDGSSPVILYVAPGNYHVAIHHRNHLGVMSAAPIALTAVATTVDLTLPSTATYGIDAQATIGSRAALWAGDVTGDGELKYVGANNDRDPILLAIGGSTPTNTVTGYMGADVTMNGVVSYIGTNNDRDPILLNIGGSTPTAVRVEQVP